MAAQQKEEIKDPYLHVTPITDTTPRATCGLLNDIGIAFYREVPVFVAKFSPTEPQSLHQTHLIGNCFNSIAVEASYSYLDEFKTQLRASLTITSQSRTSFLCVEQLQFSTTFRDSLHPLFSEGSSQLTLDFLELRDVIDIHANGLRMFTYCADPIRTISSFVSTQLLWMGGQWVQKYLSFLGSKPSTFQIEGNRDLMERWTDIEIEERIVTKVSLPSSLFKTGDLLISREWTGHSTEMMLLSGGFASQAAIIINHPDSKDVFVAECDITGVAVTPLEQWITKAEEVGLEVAYLPVRSELVREPEKLWTWAKSLDNSEYDFSLELYAAIDQPDGYLVPFNSEVFPVLLRLYDRWGIGDQQVQQNFYKGLNQRYRALSVFNDVDVYQAPENLEETMIYTAIDLNMSIQELIAVPQQDSWTQSSFTSASFIAAALRQIGVLTIPFNASEFTPKDLTQLAIFESSRPDDCVMADPHLDYCQLIGQYRLDLPGYNTIVPYDWMNERCPNSFTSFFRPTRC